MHIWLYLIIGIVVGVLITLVLMVMTMRSQMVVPERSDKSFDATCQAIEHVVPGHDDWSFPMESFDMSAKLAVKQGLPDTIKQIRLYFMCNPKIAKSVLGVNPKLSAIMPCSWSVYELEDGSVWVSHMNISMMSKMMGGVVGKSMSVVAAVDEQFLERVLR